MACVMMIKLPKLGSLRFTVVLLKAAMFTYLFCPITGRCLPSALVAGEYNWSNSALLVKATGRTLPTECGVNASVVNSTDVVVGELYTENVNSFTVVDVFKGSLFKGDEIPILMYTDTMTIKPLEIVPDENFLVFLTSYSDTCFGTVGGGLVQTNFPGSRMFWMLDCVYNSGYWNSIPNATKDFLNATEKPQFCYDDRVFTWLQICQ
jgi:hypothetical protein